MGLSGSTFSQYSFLQSFLLYTCTLIHPCHVFNEYRQHKNGLRIGQFQDDFVWMRALKLHEIVALRLFQIKCELLQGMKYVLRICKDNSADALAELFSSQAVFFYKKS